jgi:hypothetical protein
MWKLLVALAIGAAVVFLLARSRTTVVVLGVVPVALSAASTFGGLGSLAAVSLPPVLTGILYLLAEVIARGASARPVVPTTGAKRW